MRHHKTFRQVELQNLLGRAEDFWIGGMSWCKSPSVAWGHPSWPRITQLSTWQHHKHICAEHSKFEPASLEAPGKAAAQCATLARPWRLQGTPGSNHPSLHHSTSPSTDTRAATLSSHCPRLRRTSLVSSPCLCLAGLLVSYSHIPAATEQKAVVVSASH